jgi:hypothetical protein
MTRTLEAAAYWKLRARCAETQRCEVVAMQARAALVTAQQQQAAALTELGLVPLMPTFSLDDDTRTITVPDAP